MIKKRIKKEQLELRWFIYNFKEFTAEILSLFSMERKGLESRGMLPTRAQFCIRA